MAGTPPTTAGAILANVTTLPSGFVGSSLLGLQNSGSFGLQGAALASASIGAASADHFCLRWNNYQTNMTAVFDQLLQEEVFVDVTLSCDGGAQLRAHKVVLAACSPYFQAVLQHNPCKHPIIILPRDVSFSDLRAIIEFVYRGEIDVAQDQINSLLQAADALKIKGLCEVGEDPTNCPPGFTATPSAAAARSVTPQSAPGGAASGGDSNQTTGFMRQPIEVTGRGRQNLGGRGRFNTAYRPRGRPPLYGRHRVDRVGANSARAPPLGRESRESKRIKTESGEESAQSNNSTLSNSSAGGNGGEQRIHYQTSQQNDDSASTSHAGADYNYAYVKPEDQAHISQDPSDPASQRMTITPELLSLLPNSTSHYSSDTINGPPSGRKLWTDEDMEKALNSLKTSSMSLSRAAQVFGIPATTLWQRAHRMGIETPKKEGPNKTWSEQDLAGALEELRSGRMSANRASKEFGIPNSTLYKIARKEGIKLSSPFSAIQPSWNPEDLNRALDAIRGGMSVQKAATEFGIPTGTLYGRCRREGIELSKYQGVPWSEEDMKDALEAVRVGEMSINQAAIHYNLPYSSLYGRFKRGKYEDGLPHHDFLHQEMTIDHFPATVGGGGGGGGDHPQNTATPPQPQPQLQAQPQPVGVGPAAASRDGQY